MAETNLGVKLSAEGVGQVEEAFRRVGKAANSFQKEGTLLSTTLGKLAGMAAGFFAFDKVKDLLIDSTKAAIENQTAMNLLAGRLYAIGVSYSEVQPKLKEYLDTMINLGREDELMMDSIGQLVMKTKDLDEAMKLSQLASDLAASGIGDVSSNTDGLVRILMGKGTRALLQFGVVVKDNATTAEQLAAVQARVTRTTAQWADTAEGKVEIMKTQFAELKEQLGYGFIITVNNLSDAFNAFYGSTGQSSETWAKGLAKIVNVWLPTARERLGEFTAKLLVNVSQLQNIGKILNTITGGKVDWLQNLANLSENISKNVNDNIDDINKKFEDSWDAMTTASKNGRTNIVPNYGGITNAAEEAAKKIKDAFDSMTKTIMGKITDTTNKISDLRDQLSGLSDDIDDQLKKSEEAYKGDLNNMVRTTQDKIDSIDKEIADTEKKKDKGWRDQIEKLKAEKTEQNAILERLAGQGVNITTEAAKDELVVLQETHAKELQDIKDAGELKKLELQKQILEQQVLQAQIAVQTTKAGGITNLVNTEAGLLSGQENPLININFNGNVNDAETFVKLITDALNRAAALKQYK